MDDPALLLLRGYYCTAWPSIRLEANTVGPVPNEGPGEN